MSWRSVFDLYSDVSVAEIVGVGGGGDTPRVRINRQNWDFVGKFKSGFGWNQRRLLMARTFDGKTWQSRGRTQS